MDNEKPRILDLFSGAGGSAEGYRRAGFCVVGVDNKNQPHYRGEAFVQMDALEAMRILLAGGYFTDTQGRRWYLKDFSAIHASPPCERYSECTPSEYRKNHPDLIASVRELLQLTGKPYVIENVENARSLLINPVMLCGTMFGLGVWRHRYFEMPFAPLILTPPCQHDGYPVLITGTTRRAPRNGGRFEYGVQECRDASDIDWMTRTEIDKAIPPAFTQFVGAQLLAYLQRTPQ